MQPLEGITEEEIEARGRAGTLNTLKLTVAQLRAYLHNKGVKGLSTMKKNELISLVEERCVGTAQPGPANMECE